MKIFVFLFIFTKISLALVCFHCPKNKKVVLNAKLAKPPCFENHGILGELRSCIGTHLTKCATEFIRKKCLQTKHYEAKGYL